jgi:SAM-dependent methyltransferase
MATKGRKVVMEMRLKRVIKMFIPRFVLDSWYLRKISYNRDCPICGYYGKFITWFGPTLVRDSECAKCGAQSRHRLFWLWYGGDKAKIEEPILHLAPELVLRKRFEKVYADYQTADLSNNADLKLNVEHIELNSGSFNTIICNHALEHVNDRKALREIHRVLSDNGRLICSVPIVEGWEETYENDSVTNPLQRELHFDQFDHVRLYGREFRDWLRDAGFGKIQEVTAQGEDVVRYGLLRGEKVFICSKQ